MKEPVIRKWHRRVAIVIVPLLIIQAVSGIFLGVDWLLGIHQRVGETIEKNIPSLLRLWDIVLIEIHYGLGVGGMFYHILLGVGVLGVTVSGVMIFFKIRGRQKQQMKPKQQDLRS
jgi:uncharacterized iron-regulated membrane protein